MQIKDAIEKGAEILNDSVQEPRLKSRILMEYTLNKTRQYIIANDNEEMDSSLERKYFVCINELLSGKPIEYITNNKEFMKLNFFVDENVLIPRQDTEILVEEVIEISKSIEDAKILDICTGSGAIGIALKKYIEDSTVFASDISGKALEIAKQNAINNEVNISFIESDLFDNLDNIKVNIIVSNPPYIKRKIIEELDEQVKKEPYIALDGGDDGLNFYRKIINNAYKYLEDSGYLCLEIGYDQKEEVIGLIENVGKYKNIYSKKDLYGNDRIVITQIKNKGE